ncbi:gamma-glutamyltransferase [Pseudomonas matsuisoli]|uniref:Glutathione hydrolase proenzyme n=1 Tax=Pseudomonas matsuisoli TaxID=1515666 RepID=A0A917Q0B0_9PSED|nr:gamma-glutamyltransferase [Pseudomonas matsuisoli]GGK03265.1 gamma-glutamyltranspeptidase [Pseudomonas matsuisoli]
MRRYRLAPLFFVFFLAFNAHAESPDQAAVASAHPAATEAGLAILAEGGNAFDAAVAVSAALAVVEPYSSGLGGGGFFLLRQAGEPATYRFLDARERAPLSSTANLYRRQGKVERDLSLNGALAAAIPGLPAALVAVSERYGTLPLPQTLAPAIRLARNGFAVDRVYRERAQYRLAALRDDPESARLFLHDGEVPEEGFIVRQPDLADTLEAIAQRGHDGFYSGERAARMINAVRNAGGIWEAEDLELYRTVEREPLRYTLDEERTLITAPPPSAGGIALAQSLGMLRHLPWQHTNRLQRSHYIIEALRRAYRDRGVLGDPDFVEIPTADLLSETYLARLASNIDPAQATPSKDLPPAPGWTEGDHTTHFTVIDKRGRAVAATLSINLPFGAAFTAAGTGVLLNNEMDDFAADVEGANAYGLSGSQANAISAGKRPLSSMSPTFIESDEAFASFGTPGGSRIPSMVLLAIMEYLQGHPVEAWVSTPRYHHQYLPDIVEYEPGAFSRDDERQMEGRGYQMKALARPYGNQHVLLWDKESSKVQAASDPRGVGAAQVRD